MAVRHPTPLTGTDASAHSRLIEVRVTPRAGRDVIEQKDGVIAVFTRATPEGGKATDAVRKAIAKWLGMQQDQVELVAGGKSRKKLFRVTDRKYRDL